MLLKQSSPIPVTDPLPMRNTKNAIVYYLFLASPKAVAQKIITDIFKKYP
jgi:hypothetical protein